jgi:hypothetical protein
MMAMTPPPETTPPAATAMLEMPVTQYGHITELRTNSELEILPGP